LYVIAERVFYLSHKHFAIFVDSISKCYWYVNKNNWQWPFTNRYIFNFYAKHTWPNKV